MKIIDLNELQEIYQPFHGAVREWYALRENGSLPERAVFDKNFNDLKEYQMYAAIKNEPLVINYFKVGKKLEKLYGSAIEGKNLDELYNDWFRKRAYEGYTLCIAERLPVYEQHTFSTLFGKIGYYKIHLPFGMEDIQEVITYIVPTSLKFKKRWDWEKLIKKTPWFNG